MNKTIVILGYARPRSRLTIFSKIIRMYEKYMHGLDASHAYIEIENDIIESTYPKGRRIAKDEWLRHYEIVESYKFDINENYILIINWVDKNIVDKLYSLTQNIVIGATGLILQVVNPKKWSFIEKLEFNGRCRQNCTEAQIMFLAKFMKIYPTEGFDNFSVGEARDLVKDVWILRGKK